MNPGTLKRVRMVNMGGTIVSRTKGTTESATFGGEPHVPLQELLASIPIEGLAQVDVEETLVEHGLQSTPNDWRRIARRLHTLLYQGDDCDGIVVSHGTATLEELAYFLDLTLPTGKPIVVTGAMKPPNVIGSDALVNLLDAITVASSDDSCGRGVLLVMGGEIHEARLAVKADSQLLGAFTSALGGPVGRVTSGVRPHFFRAAGGTRKAAHQFRLRETASLPRVEIVMAYAGACGVLVRYLCRLGVDGIVCVGFASGNCPPDLEASLLEARAQGIAVVVSSGASQGTALLRESLRSEGVVSAGHIPPKKARLLLSCVLQETKDAGVVEKHFDAWQYPLGR